MDRRSISLLFDRYEVPIRKLLIREVGLLRCSSCADNHVLLVTVYSRGTGNVYTVRDLNDTAFIKYFCI
jgi:hypothetical protein